MAQARNPSGVGAAAPPPDKLEESIGVMLLLDFYGELLPPKQAALIQLYFGEDLSLSEAAAMTGLTRQGVRDAVKRGENTLRKTEEKLGLARRFQQSKKAVAALSEGLEAIRQRGAATKEELERLTALAKALEAAL